MLNARLITGSNPGKPVRVRESTTGMKIYGTAE